jgi:hypothetical protein
LREFCDRWQRVISVAPLLAMLAMLAGFGLELAGRAGARLAGTLGIAVHPSAVLRLVMALPGDPGAPAVIYRRTTTCRVGATGPVLRARPAGWRRPC